jgi:hypothetical protein
MLFWRVNEVAVVSGMPAPQIVDESSAYPFYVTAFGLASLIRL